jgi:hypothetical protein
MKFDKFWINLELCLTNLGRYLPIFWPVFPVFSKTGFLVAYWHFFPNEKKILGPDPIKHVGSRRASQTGQSF